MRLLLPRRSRLALAALFAAAVVLGCSHKPDEGTLPTAEKPLPALSIKDDSPDLLLTWIDDKGETHVEMKPADVPVTGRALVRVVVSDREEGTHDLFYVVDLGKKREDGTYPASTMRRREWEAEIEKRRDAYLARTAPPAAPQGSQGAPPVTSVPGVAIPGAVTVTIYGASWCGPCHQAADYLKSKGVRYVMKDVEETPGAAVEMQEKLSRIGRRGGSIPVIDVGGQILVGFSAAALDQALAKVGRGTML